MNIILFGVHQQHLRIYEYINEYHSIWARTSTYRLGYSSLLYSCLHNVLGSFIKFKRIAATLYYVQIKQILLYSSLLEMIRAPKTKFHQIRQLHFIEPFVNPQFQLETLKTLNPKLVRFLVKSISMRMPMRTSHRCADRSIPQS